MIYKGKFCLISILIFTAIFLFAGCVSDNSEFFPTINSNENSPTSIFTQNEILKPLSFSETATASASLYVRTDIPKANIYLNGNYLGRSPLKIIDLIPGYYTLKIEFTQNSEEIIIQNYLVELESNKENEYYIEKKEL